MGAPERERIPRDGLRPEEVRLQALVVAGEAPADDGRRINDDDRDAALVRVDVDEPVQPDVETAGFELGVVMSTIWLCSSRMIVPTATLGSR